MENLNNNNDNNINNKIQLTSLSNFDEKSNLVNNNINKNLNNNESITIPIQSNNSDNLKKNNKIIFKRYGRLLSIKYKEGEAKIVFGELFPFCFLFNLIFPLYILIYLYKKVHFLYYILGIIIIFAQIIFFTLTATSNPGLPKENYENLFFEVKENKHYRKCKDCKFWIDTDEGTQHCYKCKICIEGFDHHCGIMNLCIGKNNLKLFYIYILLSFIMFIYYILGFLIHKDVK